MKDKCWLCRATPLIPDQKNEKALFKNYNIN